MSAGPELPPDYTAARDAFRRAATDAGAALGTHPHPLAGPGGEALAIDTAWLGPTGAPHVVMVVSGTHGVEGFAGSMCQTRWLTERAGEAPPDGVGVLFIHAHNPYGFAWIRRVNEDNVDLNRNYGIDLAEPPSNPDYDELAAALAPSEWTDHARESTDAVILEWATLNGFDRVQAAVSAGQYRHPDGLFYGGSRPTWSQELMRSILLRHVVGAERVAILDLHTGLGPRGDVELITSHRPDTETYDRAVSWWGGQVASTEAGGSVSAALHGEWMSTAERWLEPAQVTAIALEWGTVDSVAVLQALRADAWLHNHADPTGPESPAIKAQLMEAFAPSEPDWAARVYDAFATIADQTLAALSEKG